MSALRASLLIEVRENHFHIFPAQSVPQETAMAGFGSIKGLTVKTDVQKDGTRFKYIVHSRLSTMDLINLIYEIRPGHPEILPELRLHKEELEKVLSLDPARYQYKLYRTNLFNSSYRAFPIVIDLNNLSCYYLDTLFPELVPEDGLGILIRNEEDFKTITLSGIGEPEVIDYLATKRMCPMCGVVSDSSKPPKRPWHARPKKSLFTEGE